jgi:biopolymer transport protein ExbB
MLEIIIKGGSMMVPLVGESVLALGVLLDRYLAFRANAQLDTRTMRAKAIRLLRQEQAAEAAQLCVSTPGPVSSVLLGGIQAYVRYRETASTPEALRDLVEDALGDCTSLAMAAVEKRLNVLSFIGNSAPLFGMTGTVTGMIKSFDAIAGAGALEGGIVAAGIAEALITTAAGLMIAMGAVIPYHVFMARADKIEQEIRETGSEFLDFITVKHSVRKG